jgi:UPF0271 protein
VLLDLDAGELDDETETLWGMFDILNVACGGHAGDARSMERIAKFAERGRPELGAHPSYPDRAGFGRHTMALDPMVLQAIVGEQCDAFAQIARRHGLRVGYVKPHGALYHDAIASAPIAEAALRGAIDVLGKNVIAIGAPRGAFAEAASILGIRYLREGFADRAMRPDGSLIPRSEPDALITDPARAAAQAASLRDIDVLCVHGDTPGALDIARAVREAVGG